MQMNELDVMLQDLSKAHYAATVTNTNNDYSVYSDFGSFTTSNTPARPPPPKDYTSNHYSAAPSIDGSAVSVRKLRRPPHPPKLQHVLKGDSKNHDLVKAAPR
jgi:hypothetical protein